MPKFWIPGGHPHHPPLGNKQGDRFWSPSFSSLGEEDSVTDSGNSCRRDTNLMLRKLRGIMTPQAELTLR